MIILHHDRTSGQSSVQFSKFSSVQSVQFSSVNAPQDFKTTNGSIHVLSKQEDNSADKIALLGGYSRKLVLYSKSDFALTKCDLHENYGGCRLMMMTPATITETWDQCGKAAHLDCDMYKNIRKLEVRSLTLIVEKLSPKKGHKPKELLSRFFVASHCQYVMTQTYPSHF